MHACARTHLQRPLKGPAGEIKLGRGHPETLPRTPKNDLLAEAATLSEEMAELFKSQARAVAEAVLGARRLVRTVVAKPAGLARAETGQAKPMTSAVALAGTPFALDATPAGLAAAATRGQQATAARANVCRAGGSGEW